MITLIFRIVHGDFHGDFFLRGFHHINTIYHTQKKNAKKFEGLWFSLAYLKPKNMIYFFLEIYMESQMNVGDQNSQQIGQNPINQLTSDHEIIKVNYSLLGVVVLVCFVIFGFGGYYLGKQSL